MWYSVTTCALVYYAPCCLFHHTCIPSGCPYTRLPLLVSVPVRSLIVIQKKVMKTPNGETFSFSCYQYLSPFYLPRGSFPPPHMVSSVGVLLIRYRLLLTVLLIPTDSELLLEPVLQQFNSSSGLFENLNGLKRI